MLRSNPFQCEHQHKCRKIKDTQNFTIFVNINDTGVLQLSAINTAKQRFLIMECTWSFWSFQQTLFMRSFSPKSVKVTFICISFLENNAVIECCNSHKMTCSFKITTDRQTRMKCSGWRWFCQYLVVRLIWSFLLGQVHLLYKCTNHLTYYYADCLLHRFRPMSGLISTSLMWTETEEL